MNDYEEIYNKGVLLKYGDKRDINIDEQLLNGNIYPHIYSIESRVNMLDKQIITIDPDNCKDADDGFSIYSENGKMFLAIHIADPTHYININSELWKTSVERIITHYPSNNTPIHMLPHQIMEKSSLMDNSYGNSKKAISIIVEVDPNTFALINNINLKFTNIIVRPETTLSYKEAANIIYKYDNDNDNNDENNVSYTDKSSNDEQYKIEEILNIGLKISKKLQQVRGSKTIGIKLSELNMSYVKHEDDNAILYNSSLEIHNIQKMIAEFAIFANSFVGEYLQNNLEGMGIFRTCIIGDLLDGLSSNISGRELLDNIIDNGICANYISTSSSHELVGTDVYCHFTSPIRRCSDCICHYLLKYIHLRHYDDSNIELPFDKQELEILADRIHCKSKQEKKIQFADNKFRLVQVISCMIQSNENVNIKFRITGYKNLFINCIITMVNDFNIYLSYSIRIKNINYVEVRNNSHDLDITHVNVLGKYDQGSIPELDSYLMNMFI
jgi:exoribonuclease R